MSESEKYLANLIGDLQDYGCDITDGKKKVSNKTIAGHLVAHGCGLPPAVPGRLSQDVDVAEISFKNGEARMKQKIVDMLVEMRGKSHGLQFAQICNVIEAVNKL